MRKYRDKEGLFVAEGERCVMQLLERDSGTGVSAGAGAGSGHLRTSSASVLIEAVLLRVDGGTSAGSGTSPDNASTLPQGNWPVYQLEAADFDDLSDTESNQGILAIGRQTPETPAEVLVGKAGPLLALDGIQDPGNLGTIVRSATWFSAGGLLLGHGTVDLWHPKVVRSTAGATGAVAWCRGSLPDLLPQFEKHGWQVLLLNGGPDSVPLHTAAMPSRCLFVAGNEGNGLSGELLGRGWTEVRIDGDASRVESLNVAAAVNIALYAYSAGPGKESHQPE